MNNSNLKLDWKQILTLCYLQLVIFFCQFITVDSFSDISIVRIVLPAIGMLLSFSYYHDISFNKFHSDDKASFLYIIFAILTIIACFFLLMSSLMIMISGSLKEESSQLLMKIYLLSISYTLIHYFGFWIRKRVTNNIVVKINNKVLRSGDKFIIWPFIKYDINVIPDTNKFPTFFQEKNLTETKKIRATFNNTQIKIPVKSLSDDQIKTNTYLDIRQYAYEQFLEYVDTLLSIDNLKEMNKKLEEPFEMKLDNINITIENQKVDIKIS